MVTDADPAALGAVSAEVRAEPVPDLAGLLGAGIDGLVVAASTAAHPALIRAGVAAGLPVFCEKPVAGDLRRGGGAGAGSWPALRCRSGSRAASTRASRRPGRR